MSAVEGIKSVRSVCLSVSERSHGRTIGDRNLKFGQRIDLDNISDEFEGQGHRSKVKVAMLKNVIFRLFDGVNCVDRAGPFSHDI